MLVLPFGIVEGFLSLFLSLWLPFSRDAGPIDLFAVIIVSFGGIQEVDLAPILYLRDSVSGRTYSA